MCRPFADNQGSVRLNTKVGNFRSDRLKDLREAKGLSQEQLEELSGVSHTMITKYERGKSKPSGESLNKLAVALDASTEYFYGREFDDDDPASSDPKIAAARMAYDVFYKNKTFSVEQRDRCRRAMIHNDAPRTAKAWRSFCEQIELALGPPASSGRQFDLIRSKSKK